MKIIKNIFILIAFLSVFMFQNDSYAQNIEYSVLSSGYAGEGFPSQNLTINNSDSLNSLIKQLDINPDSLKVDFDNEIVAIIVPDNAFYPDSIKIKDIEKSKSGRINVEYILDSLPYVPEKESKITKPYTLLKLKPLDMKDVQVSFKNAHPKNPVFVNQSLDDAIKYTNILKDSTNDLFINYLPLDKGNSWTYNYESEKNKASQTFSIVSYSQDWSIFDTFFGINNLAMKIDPNGSLYVSSNKGIRSFYTDDVQISYKNEPVTVDAGTFNDVIVISSPPESQIKFKDVYARDIGLIFHEHTSPNGSAKYSLASGNVRGRKIP
ncbi:MAG: hypothetical protein ACR2NW_00790 [Thermodesulfobacteriota bacterium]